MTKSTLLQFYSIVKIVKAKDLPQLSKTYKDSQERLLVMFKKKPETPRITLNDLMKEIKSVKEDLYLFKNEIKSDIAKINTRLDKHEQILKSHDQKINYLLLQFTKKVKKDC